MKKKAHAYPCSFCPHTSHDKVSATLHSSAHKAVTTEPAPMYYLVDQDDEVVGTALDLEAALDLRDESFPGAKAVHHLVLKRRARRERNELLESSVAN